MVDICSYCCCRTSQISELTWRQTDVIVVTWPEWAVEELHIMYVWSSVENISEPICGYRLQIPFKDCLVELKARFLPVTNYRHWRLNYKRHSRSRVRIRVSKVTVYLEWVIIQESSILHDMSAMLYQGSSAYVRGLRSIFVFCIFVFLCFCIFVLLYFLCCVWRQCECVCKTFHNTQTLLVWCVSLCGHA